MAQNRYLANRDNSREKNNAAALAVETLRSASEKAAAATPTKGEENVSWFWRIFGGTILSIVALVVMTAYTQMTSSLTDLRRDFSQLQEARGDLLKKDEFNGRLTALWNAFKELQTAQQSLATLNERTKLLDTQFEKQTRISDDDRRELARKIEEQRRLISDDQRDVQRKMEEQVKQMQALAERMASLEGRNAGTAAVKGPTAPTSPLKKLARPITGG